MTTGLADTSFRRPDPPAPIERCVITHPLVPPGLDGFTILHLSDTHVRRPELGHAAFLRLTRALAAVPADMVALTGDYMSRPGDEPAALLMLQRLADTWRARVGAWGVFGNHDSTAFVEQARRIGAVRWLANRSEVVDGLPLEVVGASYPEDLVAEGLDRGVGPGSAAGRFRLLLAHHPTVIYQAASLGVPVMLCGHTHGGQIRASRRVLSHTSCDLPGRLASGVIRLRDTVCVISRGLGEVVLNLRLNCPQQAPLIELRRGPIGPPPDRLSSLRAW